MRKLKLFKETLSCQDCLYSWEGLAHGFSRGHSVLIKEKKILLISDDIWYSFPKGTDFDMDSIFAKHGWRPIESCPKCLSKNIFPPIYDKTSTIEIEYIEVEYEHFEKIKSDWKLSKSGKLKFV